MGRRHSTSDSSARRVASSCHDASNKEGGDGVSPQRHPDHQPTSSKTTVEPHNNARQEEEKEAVNIPDFTHLPPPWAQNCEDIWQEGVRHVRTPDGAVDNWDVVNWIITRKGGVDAKWEELEEGKGLIEEMRRDSIDVNQILARQAMEAEERQRKEERRLANKRWFQPKGGRQKVNKTRRSDGSAVSTETSTSFGVSGEENGGNGV